MAEVRLEGVRRVHPDGTAALDGVDLEIADGQLLAVIGPSGAGKSTLLRVISGLERPTSGRVWIGGRVADDLPARERDLGYVPQDQNLIPTRTVARQLSFPLEIRDVPRAEIDKRVDAEGGALGVRRLFHRRPHELSAGEAQKVSLGRARTRVPSALLLDEPLSMVDAGERLRMRHELRTYQQAAGLTVVLATNDHAEALGIADRVAILDRGRVAQCGTPAEVLHRPATTWVATFVGDPPMALAEAVVEDRGGLGHLRLAGQRLRVPGGLPGPLRSRVGQRVLLGARPHLVRAAGQADPVELRLEVAVAGLLRLPHEDRVRLALAGGGWVARFPPGAAPPEVGEVIEVAVDVRRLTVFDPTSGRAVWHGEG